jgi:hypothetical protein
MFVVWSYEHDSETKAKENWLYWFEAQMSETRFFITDLIGILYIENLYRSLNRFVV